MNDNFEKKQYFTIYKMGIARKLLKAGYQIADIGFNTKDSNKVVFHFYDKDGRIREYIEILKKQEEFFNNNK